MSRIASLCLIAALALSCGDDDADSADAGPQVPDANVSGTITFAWSLEDPDGNPLDCTDVDATIVSITAQPIGTLGGETDAFSCILGQATTRGLPPRPYNLELAIRTQEGLLAERMQQSNITVDPQQDTDIGTVTFVVDPTGSFTFTLATDDEGGNCESGAGITSFELELRKDGTCVPTAFAIEGIGTPYMNNCGGEVHAACIDNATEITVSDIPSGQYTLAVSGTIESGTACYVTTSQFGVPGNEIIADLGQIDLPLDLGSAECNPDAFDAGVSMDGGS